MCSRDFSKTLSVRPARNGYPALFIAGKVKAMRKRSGAPTSVTPLLVHVGSLTATFPHEFSLRDQRLGLMDFRPLLITSNWSMGLGRKGLGMCILCQTPRVQSRVKRLVYEAAFVTFHWHSQFFWSDSSRKLLVTGVPWWADVVFHL